MTIDAIQKLRRQTIYLSACLKFDDLLKKRNEDTDSDSIAYEPKEAIEEQDKRLKDYKRINCFKYTQKDSSEAEEDSFLIETPRSLSKQLEV